MDFRFDLAFELWISDFKSMEGFLNPEEVLNQLDLREDMVVADFGCGSGGWVIPLAKRLKAGRIYAIDILEEPLSALKSKIQIEKISNIEIILSDVESKNGSTLNHESCDLVLMTNLFFELEDKKSVLEEGKRVLKEGGKILVVDWEKDAPLGPKERGVSAEDIKKIAKDIDLKIEREFETGSFHWGLILVK